MSEDRDDLLAQAQERDVNYEDRLKTIKFNDRIDCKYGFEKYTEPAERNAWLSEIVDEQTKIILAAVDFYFIEDSGKRFRIAYPFRPYFYIATTDGAEHQVASYISKKYGNSLVVDHIDKEDLDLANHLAGIRKTYLKLSFPSTSELNKIKKDLMPEIRKNKERIKKESQYCTYLARNMGGENHSLSDGDVLSEILDIREYDLPYHMRVAIDEKLFVGKWYVVRGMTSDRCPSILPHPTLIDPIDPVVLAFDIETTKLPLKFPDSATDEIMMISYMVDGLGFLIINREILSADIENFEYTPKEEFKGEFTVWNEADEVAVLRRFFDHILEVQPNIIVTYNGDFFDWPFVETRAQIRGMNMLEELGFSKVGEEYRSRNCIHMDAFCWVKRDSYLPVGSQNLKAAAKAKLRYDPEEVDPEEMCRMARDDPQKLSNYSVSDAVATYYLYMKYVHPFVFALCTIIPLGPDDVLRKGSGTLCEALLMVEAFHNEIVFPNKYTGGDEAKMSKDGHRIESETYVGGHVEALEAGVFRADIPCRFRLVPTALAALRDEVPSTIEKELKREFGILLNQVVDFEEKCAEVQAAFQDMLDIPSRLENPRIYHLDVGAMYPNIILTNRLQPCAIVDEEICMSCTYNKPDALCKRTMDWEWRGELTPATRGEYQQIMQQLEGEMFGKPPKPFHQLDRNERALIEKKRVQDYSRRVYGKTHLTRLEKRKTTICQRENAFYVDTVKAFRDRRYDYKELLKKAKTALDECSKDDVGAVKAAQGRVVLYESLQLAHKCILNSFYGYVMRKGSRWFSMEMAGIVCHTGANIITEARKLVEQIGKPLELDTDGIWCLIPASFPENVTFKLQNHKKKTVTVSYPAAMLNALVNQSFTNDQYHNLEKDGSYSISSENSIFFEVDGPYQCMVLPASKEEGKKLKKRYAVFNLDGSMAELKGFEVKRRGELNIIKHFQSLVFKSFLRGNSLEEVYESVARDADYWLDVLFSKGVNIEDSELFDLISENRSMSRKLEDYGAQKSTSISTAKRLAEFLGDSMVKDAGLACKFVISKHPLGAPVTERAIPIAIFQADPKTSAHYLRLWTKQSNITHENVNIRDLLDWDYYVERLGNCIQKIITIPAALQGVSNPVPRIAHPDWLQNKIKNRIDSIKQPKITDIFQRAARIQPALETNQYGKRVASEDPNLDEDKENEPKKTKSAKANNVKETLETQQLERKTLLEHGFEEWNNYRKTKYRMLIKRRKQVAREECAANVGRIVSQARERVKERTWQVLSIEENYRSPGYFNLWVATEGQMKNMSLKVEKSIVINSRVQQENREIVRRTLPHRKEAHFLYEIKSDEAEFQKLLDRTNAQLCSAEVEGIYETQTPLWFRALVHLGCLCRPTVPPSGGSYMLDTLRMVPLTVGQTYLGEGSTRSIFLYKYSQDTRHVWCLIDPSTKQGFYYVVNRGDLSMPNMDKLYMKVYEQQKEEADNFAINNTRTEIHFTVTQFGSAKECEKEISKNLRMCREATARPTLLALISNEDPSEMAKVVPNMTLFPHLKLHVSEPSSLLNKLEWQREVGQRCIRHFFNSFYYLEDYAMWARYLHIPICNVPADPALLGLDLFFARQLTQGGHVLWASSSSRPDLGGKEIDDLRLSVEWKTLVKDHSVLLNRPSFSAHACVQIELEAVAVTALVQRARLLEAEGADDTVTFDSTVALPADSVFGVRNPISAYDEGASVDAVLKLLRQLLADCVRHIAQNGSKQADQMALALSRWLHSPTSLLYDPTITRNVAVLEKKLVLLLCAEIERLGAKVVYASASRVVLNTGRVGCDAARSFAEMLIRSLSNNPLFAALSIRRTHTYDSLLWYDGFNFTGIGDEEVTESVVDELGEEQTITTNKPITHTRWRMSDDLTDEKKVKEEFIKIVSGYVFLYIKECRNREFDDESGVIFRSDIIEKQVGHRMYKYVNDLLGAHVEDAAVFCRKVRTALACDVECEESVDSLWENLTRILDGHPVAEEEPTVYLANVFCSHCSQASDIDLGDPHTVSCSGCQKKMDPYVIDTAVSEKLNALMVSYLMQDHVCIKCKSIRRDVLSKYCDCSGRYTTSIDSGELVKNARAVSSIGKFRQLSSASETARWILSSVRE